MKHLGDITKISGHEAPTVDCVIGGSPCQDLSVAGKRAGLAGERSGLYMEQIRIIKEMREHDRLSGRTGVLIRPRYMVWENVPGAFSSNGGKDFAAVLEEAIRIAEPEAPDVPVPPKGWPTSGCIRGMDGRWSIAWRVLDAQFWGVPQRRRRIALVADFGGDSASEILFVREGVRGHLEESEPQRKEAARDAGASTGVHHRDGKSAVGIDMYNQAVTGDKTKTLNAAASDADHVPCVMEPAFTLKIRGGCEGGGKGALIQTDKSATLSTLQDQTLFQPICDAIDRHILDDQGGQQIGVRTDGKSPTLRAEMHGNVPCVFSIENHPADSRVSIDESGKVQTLTSRMGTGGGNVPMIMEPFCKSARPKFADDATVWKPCKVTNTLNTFDLGETRANELVVMAMADKETTACGQPVAYGIGSYHSNAWKSDNPHSGVYEADTSKTLDAVNCGYPACNQGGIAVVQNRACLANGEQITGTLCAGAAQRGFYGGQEIFGGAYHVIDGRNPHTRYIVRRLTPLECERLQGFPDGWTDIGEWVDSKGKKHKDADSPRYKALGNSIAIPPWKWVLKRICACYERDATMASLFDGIGGFPYIWEQFNGKGSCLWASEIEEFPMAVTKLRFGGAE